MDTLISLLAIVSGLILRLAIPIAITAGMIFLLKKLDARWQVEAQLPVPVEKPQCWKVKDCPPDQVKNCVGATSPLPCWQAFRLPNGYLREDCLSCKVFMDAPMPALKIAPRRM